ncbi:flagellar basal body-associated FliL family protein [Bdellovibrio sp. HCB2-146]|uniref:flagellar basal body-associated FliL family protein n=1 Tax=Bdellovibrio sp. HCB2-146 TaxID=3394362 RepID=UPI0039BCEA5B
MAENETTTKVEPSKEEAEKANGAEEAAEGSLSLEDLDNIIADEDPEFAQSLSSIGPDDPAANAEIYSEELELEYTLETEIKLWTASRPRLMKWLPFLPKLSFKLKVKRAALRLNITRWKEQFIHGLINIGPTTLQFIKGIGGHVKSGLAAFKSWTLAQKLGFVGLLVATGVGGFVIYKASTHHLIPPAQELFMGSLEEWSQATGQYDPKTELEPFYDSTRVSQNIMQLKKMVANIKRSENSGANPMGAFEFYLEGTVAEVLVEIKDREPEMMDLFLRTISEMTYDQLSSGEGKQLLCDRLRKNINGVLTKGKVRRVFIKTAIVKP